MRFEHIRTIYRKEMLETLRDRRTILLALIVPMLIYPIMAIVVVQVTNYMRSQLEKQEVTLAVSIGPSSIFGKFNSLAQAKKVSLVAASEADGRELLQAGQVHARVVLPGERDGDLDPNRQWRVNVYYDSGELKSQEAYHRVREIFDEMGKLEIEQRLADMKLPVEFAEPFDFSGVDLASPSRRGAYMLGGVLSFLLITMALSGAFYVAVDITAGEKERGTLETLLVAPVSRKEIIIGKYLTVLTIAIVTSLLNIVSMGVTFSNLVVTIGEKANIDFSLGPRVFFGIILALLPLAALFSAITVGTSSFAKSFREGQNYLTPLFILIMFPALLPMFPGVNLTTLIAAVPVAGPALLFRMLLLGEADLLKTFIVFGSTLVYAGVALFWASKLYEREDVLFSSAASTPQRFGRARVARATPTPALALWAFFGVFALYAVISFNQAADAGLVKMLAVPQSMFLFAPLLVAWWCRNDFRKTFSLTVPRAGVWPAALIAGSGGILLAMSIAALTQELVGAPEIMKQIMGDILEQAGPFWSLACIAALPALCEEMFCRGYIFSGLRSGRSARSAILISGLLFGLLHVDARIPATAFLGFVLAAIVNRSGSIFPAMLIHFINNSFALLVSPEYQTRFADGFLCRCTRPVVAYLDEIQAAGMLWVAPILGLVLLVAGMQWMPARRGQEIASPELIESAEPPRPSIKPAETADLSR